MTIGERIKKRRQELKMSQEELALKVGYKSRTSINKIELNERQITQQKIKAIADALETTPAYIMGWSDLRASGKDAWLLNREEFEEKQKIYDQLNSDTDRRLLAYWAATASIDQVKAVLTLIEKSKG